MNPVGRANSGHRQYGQDDLNWVNFLTHLRKTGMPIKRMLEFAKLERQGERTTAQRRRLLEEHRQEVLRNIEQLQQHLAVIESKISHYYEHETSAQ